MSIFTIKRHLLFVRIVCGWFLLYNILGTFDLSIDDRGFPDTWLAVGGITGFILRSSIYFSTHLVVIIVVGVFHLAGVVAAISALTINEKGRVWIVRLFYVTMILAVLKFFSETASVYCLYNTTHWKEGKLGGMLLYVFVLHQAIYTVPLFIVILFWIIKQFKSRPIKNLFQQKSAPEISETL